MGRYRSRYARFSGNQGWREFHESKHAALHRRYGAIVADVQRDFLALQDGHLDHLLKAYSRQYGESATQYAKTTYASWKNGSVQMSGQTAQRLLDLVPRFLSSERRFELVCKLRSHYLRRSREVVRCGLLDWHTQVSAAIDSMIAKSHHLQLPREVVDGAKWLANDDARAAQSLLAKADEFEARNRASYLNVEFQRLQVMMSRLELGVTTTLSHRIVLPQGDIDVEISHVGDRPRPSALIRLLGGARMDKTDDNSPKNGASSGGDALVPAPRSENLLDLSTRGLSEAEARVLKAKALDAKLQVDRQRVEADDRFANSSRDMANTVKIVESLDQAGKSDYEVNAQYHTASGQTTVRVKKATNQAIVIIAIAVAAILLLLLLRR